MSNVLKEDIANTIEEINKPSGMASGVNWLRHDGIKNTIFDEMLLTGVAKKQVAKILVDRQLDTDEKKALSWINRHLRHLKSEGKTECERGHNLPIKEDFDGKLCFDLKKMESMLNGNTNASPCKSTSSNPTKDDVDAAELQLRKTSPDEVIGTDAVLDQIEDNFKKAGKPLKENWRDITKRNIPIWFSKK